MYWTGGTTEVPRRYETQMEGKKVVQQKYIKRKFTYVTKTCEDKSMGKFGGILQDVGDDKSYIMPLDKHLDASSWRPTFNECMDRLNYVS